MNEWRDISTAPTNKEVLVFLGGQQFVAWFQDDGYDPDHNRMWLVDDNKNGPYPLRGGRPTHWMPLPEPPK